jgi:uncharacterized protein (TIGR02145 family)
MACLVIVCITCKKDPENPFSPGKFEFGQTTVDSISYRDLVVTTQISNLAGNTAMQYGHCWDTVNMPDINDSITSNNGNPANLKITSNITNLNPANKYFVRAYCKLSNTTVYSSEVEVTTLKTGKPSVGSLTISNVTLNSAICDGVIVSDSGLSVSEKGVCWDTVSIFTVTDCQGKMTGGTGTGQFTCQVRNLLEGKNYFIKVYAINQAGTSYGNLMNFQTTPVTLPEVTTAEITQITTNSALGGGEVSNSGNGTVSARGICWGTGPGVTIENNIGITQEGTGTGAFTSSITGLQDGLFYFVKAYATNEKGTAYGEERSYQTTSINLPTVTTSPVSNVTSTSAKCGGNVLNSGNGTVSARGVCWGLNSDVILQSCLGFTTNGSGTGSFTSDITGLAEGNTYFVRSYATNENGTGYGATQVINTPSIPTLTTTLVSNITTTTAISGGEVTFDGFGTVSGRGICWGTSPNPAIGNCLGYTNDGSGMGSYTSLLSGLTPETLYYVRAYAINELGTAYGDLKSFITAAVGVPTVISENISNITINTATGGGNVTDNGSGTVISRGICWGHEPSPTLENALGFTNNGSGSGSYTSLITGLTAGTLYYVRAYATNEAGTGYGDLKSFSTLDIMIPEVTTTEVTNITTNSAQSGGEVVNANNGTVGVRGVCWNTDPNPTLTDNLGYTTDESGIGEFISNLSGLSLGTNYYVRAYATNEAGTGYGNDEDFRTSNAILPTVITAQVSNINANSAESGGEVSDDGYGTVSSRGICWNTIPEPTLTNNIGYTTDGNGLGSFTSLMTNLADTTTFYVRAYATNEAGTAYGNEESFTTFDDPCDGDTTITYEGQVYKIVAIGDQCWMGENLNVGVMIPGIQNQTNNGQIEKYCYYDEEDSCSLYGALYQWNEMMNYPSILKSQGICPAGWHIPQDEEWKMLEGFVDSEYGIGDPEWDLSGYRGFDAGLKLRSTYGWIDNGNGTDEFLFTFLPSGLRSGPGNFERLGNEGTSWSSTTENNNAITRMLSSILINQIARGDDSKSWGYSVRCLKD